MMWKHTQHEMKVLLLATLLVFSGYGFLLASSWQTAGVGVGVQSQAANSVGVLAAVPNNEVNTLAQQLREREADLALREEAFRTVQNEANVRTLTLVSVIGVGLLGLILMNFYLDTRRRQSLA